jgi:hypothetical protein
VFRNPTPVPAVRGFLVGTLAFTHDLDIGTLTVDATLGQTMQIAFWINVGIWVFFRTKISSCDLILRSGERAEE